MNKVVRFIHFGDTHLRDDPEARMYGVNVYDAALKAVEAVNSFTLPFDFVVHTGDVTSVDGTQKEYELAAEIFKKIEASMYFVTGNHDNASLMRRIIKFGEKKKLLTDENKLFFFFFFYFFIFLKSMVISSLFLMQKQLRKRIPMEDCRKNN